MNITIKIAQRINLLILISSALLLLFFPFKKDIWYDETVSIEACNGITYHTPKYFDSLKVFQSKDIQSLNDLKHVFVATAKDNSNSFLYNILLHYFIKVTGNNLWDYIVFSRIFAVMSLIAFFFLANLLFGESLFTSIALLFLLSDITFWGMGNEIRTYSLGIFCVIMTTLFLFKFLKDYTKIHFLLYISIFATASIFCHFFSIYILAVLYLYLLYCTGKKILSLKYIYILCSPIPILLFFFYHSKYAVPDNSLHTMVLNKVATTPFTLNGLIINFMKFTSINFRLIFPKIIAKDIISIVSFMILFGVFTLGFVYAKKDKNERNKFIFLFFAAISGSIFLTAMGFYLKTLTPFYFRYFSFSIPFFVLFLIHFLQLLYKKTQMKLVFIFALLIFMFPAGALFTIFLKTHTKDKNYNHMDVATEIVKLNCKKIDVPNATEAMLLQCFLPSKFNIEYRVIDTSHNFILYCENGSKNLKIINKDNNK